MGKRFGLFQITQMTGLFDDLKLTIQNFFLQRNI